MAPKERPLARVSRSCGTCRAVKRRCDRQLPRCGQCTRTREACLGYRNEWDLLFRDQTARTIQRSKDRRERFPTPPVEVDLRAFLAQSPSPDMNQMGVQYFLHHFVADGLSNPREYLSRGAPIGSLHKMNSTLATSMAAVGLEAIATSMRQPGLAALARAKYVEAIRAVNAALSSPTEAIKDSTLMSVISLGYFSYTSNFDVWHRHVQGAAALVVLRGKDQFASTAAIPLFNQVRADVAIACIQKLEPFPRNLLELEYEANNHIEGARPVWVGGTLASRCATLLWDVRERTEVPQHELLEKTLRLRNDVQDLFAVLGDTDSYEVIRIPSVHSELAFNGRLDLYATPWTIRLWNNVRMVQTVVCEILIYLLHECISQEFRPSFRDQLGLELFQTLELLKKLGDDMMATVPQALGVMTPKVGSEDSNISKNLADSAPVFGGFMLAWWLYATDKSPVISTEARRWIIRQLECIQKELGIVMTSAFIEEIRELKELADCETGLIQKSYKRTE